MLLKRKDVAGRPQVVRGEGQDSGAMNIESLIHRAIQILKSGAKASGNFEV